MQKAQHIEATAALMGSPFSIQAYVSSDWSKQSCLNTFNLAFAEIRRIEDLLTDFRESPFNRINNNAGIRPTKVTKEIYDLIDLSLNVSRDSDGAFDITYAAIGHLWRDAAKKGTPPTSDQIEKAKEYIGYEEIQMNPRTLEVHLPRKGMKIGFGGVGKGYAVDKAFDLLIQEGFENVMVNGAGDIRLHSSENAPRPWRVGIRNPFAPKDHAMGFFTLSHGSVATSGDYERYFRHHNEKFHHVFDARNGQFTQKIASVTLIAQTTLMADIYATTAMALGPDEGLAFLNRRRNVRALIITHDERILKTENLMTEEVHS